MGHTRRESIPSTGGTRTATATELFVSSPAKLFTSLLMMGALLAGCGSQSMQDPASTPKQAAQSKPAKQEPLKSSEIFRLRADLTGQVIFAEGPPVAGFVGCLRRLDAPASVIDAWQPG